MRRVKKLICILTLINILLLVISISLYLRSVKIGRIIDEVKNTRYIYSLDKDKAILEIEDGRKVEIYISNKNIKVKDIYLYDSDEERVYIVSFLKSLNNLVKGNLKRSTFSMLGECRLHTLLYKIGFKREQTVDVDIDKVKDKRWGVNVLSTLLY